MSAWYAVNRLANRGGRVMVLLRVLGRDVETLISTQQIAAA